MNKKFSYREREEYINSMPKTEYDLFVIGGGINGAGVAREAALRGMKVALVEMSDFASGTSSRSSKLIHGGLRYLENLDFHLVFEALSERALLFEMAPHLAHPLRFLVPLYKSGRVGPFKMGLGMWLYDLLALFQTPEMHRYYNSEEAVQRLPILKAQGLSGAFEYSDGYMDDDRLVIETLRSANEWGAHAVNYVKAQKPLFGDDGQLVGFECEDLVAERNFTVKAQHIVSTVGPWTDRLAANIFPDWQPIMRPSKGVHLTFSKKDIPLTSAVVMAAEKRIVFAIPRNEMVIVGTTDTDYKEDPAEVKTTSEDVEYLLQVTRNYFPGAKVSRENIISSYAGVRPLVDDGSSTEGKTSREHTIKTHRGKNFTFVAGGKYTTYRKMSQEVVDSCLEAFSFEESMSFFKSQSKAPINELSTVEKNAAVERQSEELCRQYEVPEVFLQNLLQRHGSECLNLLEKSLKFKSLVSEDRYWLTELDHAVENTMCVQLSDFYLRRTPLMLAFKDHGLRFESLLNKHFEQEIGVKIPKTSPIYGDLKRHMDHEMSWRPKSSV